MESQGNLHESRVFRAGYDDAVLFKRPFNGLIYYLFPAGFLQFKYYVLFRMYPHCNQRFHFGASFNLKGHRPGRSGRNYVIVAACFYGKTGSICGRFAYHAVEFIVFAEKVTAVCL